MPQSRLCQNTQVCRTMQITFYWCNRCCCCYWRCENFQAEQCSLWLHPRNRNMWRRPPEEEEPPPAPCCLVHTHRLRNKNLHPFLLRCRPQAGTRDTNKKVRLYPKKQHLRPLMEFLPFPMHIAKCRSGDNLLFFRGPHHTFDAWLFCPPARISSSFYSDFDAYPLPPPLIEDLNLRPRLSDYWNE